MKKFLVALLLTFLCQTAFAEFITVLPVSNRQIENAVSELVTLSELHGKTTTIRYWVNDPKTPFVAALNTTNIIPSNSLATTEDLLVENKFDGMYVGAESQTEPQVVKVRSQAGSQIDAQTGSQIDAQSGTQLYNLQHSIDVVDALAFTETTQNYQAKARSSVALAALIEDQTKVLLNANSNASELVSLSSEDIDIDVESGLMAGDKTTIMDTLLSGMTRSTDYELPMSTDNILISGIGGAILNGYSVTGGGSGSGSGTGGSFAGSGGGSVPEPTTWAMLLFGSLTLVWFRKFQVNRCTK